MAGQKSSTWANGLLQLLFNNVAFGGVGDSNGLQPSAAAGNLYLSLHTADPGPSGDQTTSEIASTGYARAAVPRDTSGFTVTTNSVDIASAVTFPAITGGSAQTATHFGCGTAASGAGKLLYSGPLTPNIPCQNGVTPQIKTAGTAITES